MGITMAFSLRRKFRKFRSDTAANMSIMLGLGATVLLAAAGGAIDFARWTSMKSELQVHLDAAVLAGTQKLAESNGDEKGALKVAKAHFEEAIAGQPDLVDNHIKFVMNGAKTGVVSKGNANLETSLLKAVGITKLPLRQTSEAEIGTASSVAVGNLEVALVLDVTGSMCADGTGPCSSGAKLTAMKNAAKDLLDAVVWDDQSTYTSKVSIVPFASAVRVGPNGGGSAMMAKLTNLPANWSGWYRSCLSGYSTTNTEGELAWVCNAEGPVFEPGQPIIPCVTGRYLEANADPFVANDDPPGPGAWLLANDGTRAYASVDSSDTPMTSGLGLTSSDLSTGWNYGDNGACHKVSESGEMMPLSNNKVALKAKIDGLEAHGATAGQWGLSFGWYTISPRWSSVWSAASAPGSYADLSATNSTGAKKTAQDRHLHD